MTQAAVQRLESQMEKLREQIEQDPDEDSMVELAEQMNADHSKVQEALQYAELSDDDYERLMEFVEEYRK